MTIVMKKVKRIFSNLRTLGHDQDNQTQVRLPTERTNDESVATKTLKNGEKINQDCGAPARQHGLDGIGVADMMSAGYAIWPALQLSLIADPRSQRAAANCLSRKLATIWHGERSSACGGTMIGRTAR